MANLIKFPDPDAEAHARAETERKKKLFDWADTVLEQLGLTLKVAQAQSISDLLKVVLDLKDPEIEIAIRDALHPTNGGRAPQFTGMKAPMLKRILQARFADMKKTRQAELLGHSGAAGSKGASSHNWTADLKLDADGGVRPILANLILFLRNHPAWKGVLAFNEFSARVAIRKRPCWGDEPPNAPWTDHHDSLTRVWFQGEDIAANQGDVGRAVQAAARANPFHPVRDYLDAVAPVWDGKPRIDTWLSVYLHADDTPYTRAVGPRYLISAVARIYEPGCKADYAIVLEGPQGKQKSEGLRTLASDAWFTDRLSQVSSKDAAQETAGVWIIEISEMDALIRATSSSFKSFLTRRSDRYRPPYGRHTIDQQRQCIFAGTINPPVGGYLKDSTGSRRIWPVMCRGMIDLEALARDRDQLWAEAVVRYRAGSKWWLETLELEALATAEQAERYKTDPWQEPIAEWLGDRDNVAVAEVLEQLFGQAPLDQGQAAQNRVAHILTHLGFGKHRPRKEDGARENRYFREKMPK